MEDRRLRIEGGPAFAQQREAGLSDAPQFRIEDIGVRG
jgi:hypothetical protein